MPILTFSNGAPSDTGDIVGLIEALVDESILTFESPTRATFTVGTTTFVLRGTDLTYASDGGERILSGGTIDSLRVSEGGTLLTTLSQLNLDISDLANAVFAEDFLGNVSAIEDLILGMDWVIRGNSNDDILLESAQSTDGVPINLIGDDVVRLGAGNDIFFLGDGDDRGFGQGGVDFIDGGDGRDIINGGAGNDVVEGGEGNDRLFGANDDDVLRGEAGADLLSGGSGDDDLTGGTGNDRLRGGSGEDDFFFTEGDGVDIIVDFTAGEDQVHLIGTEILEIRDVDRGTLVFYEGGRVLLEDVDASTLGEGDIVSEFLG